MTSGEGRFVDANVLVYAALRDDPRHNICRTLLKNVDDGPLYLSQQILSEFYSTITSPKRVTAPYAPAEALEFIETLIGYDHVVLLPVSQDVPARWLSLLRRLEIRGAQVFDIQIAATMLANGVTRLLTYNGADFKDVVEVTAATPASQVGE